MDRTEPPLIRGLHALQHLLVSDAEDIEPRVPPQELSHQMRRGSVPSSSFLLMLTFAAFIATLGLLANSAPAIIGAMIIAPLMTPIMSLAYGLSSSDRRMALAASLTILIGMVMVVAVGWLCVVLLGWRVTGSEILSRSSPSLIDLGIAMAAGGAGAFSQTRRSIANSIAGVAIAVALVPPLATVGIGMALGSRAVSGIDASLSALGMLRGGHDIAAGSFLLYLTNLMAILTVSVLVFAAQRYGNWKRAILALAIFSSALVLLVPPLKAAMVHLWVKNRVMHIIAVRRSQWERTARGKITSIHVTRLGGILQIRIDAFMPEERVESLRTRIDRVREVLSKEIGEPVALDVNLIPIRRIRFTASPPAPGRR